MIGRQTSTGPRSPWAALPYIGESRPQRALVSLARERRRHVAFSATGVTKVFGETVALWNVDLTARAGELLAVAGSNASGKSTLLRVIAGLASPTRGSVSWTVTPPGSQPRVALLGHATHLFGDLTAAENLWLATRLVRGDEARAIQLLDRLGLAEFAGRRTSGLSAGTRRRLGLARAVATDPDVLLVDEPFAGLDREARDRVAKLLVELRDEGRIVVAALQDDATASAMATRAVLLDRGRLIGSVGDRGSGAVG